MKVLREALEHQRKINGSMTVKFQKEMDMRLEQQKKEYDATVTRHQNFIDQVTKLVYLINTFILQYTLHDS